MAVREWLPVVPDGRDKAAELVTQWGYFRKPSENEIRHCKWFAFVGEDGLIGLAWFSHQIDPGEYAVHACTDPMARGRISDPETMAGLEAVARSLGAIRLFSFLTGGEEYGLPVPVIKRWLRARGWREHDVGMVRDLEV